MSGFLIIFPVFALHVGEDFYKFVDEDGDLVWPLFTDEDLLERHCVAFPEETERFQVISLDSKTEVMAFADLQATQGAKWIVVDYSNGRAAWRQELHKFGER